VVAAMQNRGPPSGLGDAITKPPTPVSREDDCINCQKRSDRKNCSNLQSLAVTVQKMASPDRCRRMIVSGLALQLLIHLN
jgi:hypothetical protein